MKPKPDYSLYVVTDSGLSKKRSTVEIVTKALDGGATIIQYREKSLSFRGMVREATAIKELVKARGALFLINDRVDLALAVSADGVHLGQQDMQPESARNLMGPDSIIGVSVQSVDQAVEAVKHGADYLGISGVFPTDTKPDVGVVLGLNMIRIISQTVPVPTVGIGGISADNATDVVLAGASGVAVVSAVVSAPDVKQACHDILKAVQQGRKSL